MWQMEPLIFLGHYGSISRLKLPHRQRRTEWERGRGGGVAGVGVCMNRISWTLSAHALITCCRLATSKQSNRQQTTTAEQVSAKFHMSTRNWRPQIRKIFPSRSVAALPGKVLVGIAAREFQLKNDSDNLFNWIQLTICLRVLHHHRAVRGEGRAREWISGSSPIKAKSG